MSWIGIGEGPVADAGMSSFGKAIDIDFFVEVVGYGVSVYGISEKTPSTLWCNIPFSQLCLVEVLFPTTLLS